MIGENDKTFIVEKTYKAGELAEKLQHFKKDGTIVVLVEDVETEQPMSIRSMDILPGSDDAVLHIKVRRKEGLKTALIKMYVRNASVFVVPALVATLTALLLSRWL